MVKLVDCGLVVSEFELQLSYYVYFRINPIGKGIHPLIPPGIGQLVPLLVFHKDGLGIK